MKLLFFFNFIYKTLSGYKEMEIQSKNVYAERVDMIPGIVSKYYVLAKGRPGGVLEIVYVTLYASGDDKIKNVYRAFKINNVEARIDNGKDVDAGGVEAYVETVYLADGMEIGIRLQGEKFDSPCQVFVHYLFHRDEV